MTLINRIKNQKIFLVLFTLYIPLFRYFISLNNSGGHTFMTADWLVNYNYGFVKRGLFGTIILSVTRDKDILLDLLSFSLILIYILIFFLLNKIYNSKKQNYISVVLILSPAAFLFPIYDSQGSFRKEILGFLAILLLASSIKTSAKKTYIFMSLLIYSLAVFSHSVNVFLITTIFVLIYVFFDRKSILYILFSIPVVSYLFLYYLFSSSEQELYVIRDNICNDLFLIGLQNLCGYGTFDFLVWDVNANFLLVQNYIINENRNQYYFYFILFFLSIIPYIFDTKSLKLFKYYLFISISFIPLFLYAYDWGRWIYIMSFCYLIIYLLSDKSPKNVLTLILLFIYPFLYRMEHCCKPMIHFEDNFVFKNVFYILEVLKNIT